MLPADVFQPAELPQGVLLDVLNFKLASPPLFGPAVLFPCLLPLARLRGLLDLVLQVKLLHVLVRLVRIVR